MHKKALLALMLVMAMLLSGCALIEKDLEVDRATEVIRVGDTVFTKGDILDETQYQLEYMAYYYNMFGMSYDVTDPAMVAETQQSVIDSLIQMTVCEDKVKELGLDQLTAEEQAKLDEQAEATWQMNLEDIQASFFADTELTGDELTAALNAKAEELGLTREYVTEYEKSVITDEKLRAYAVADVAVTAEELQAKYDEEVAADKEAFAATPASYGSMVNAGTTVYYRPAGYRMVKQILVKFTEEDQALIDSLNSAVSTQQNAVASATAALTELGVTDAAALTAQVSVTVEETDDLTAEVKVTDVTATFGEDVSADAAEQAKALAQAERLLTIYNEKLAAAKKNAYDAIDAETDAIMAELASGADWDTLMAEKTEDPGMQSGKTAENGYAICADTLNMDEPFVKAAMALEQVGSVSPKTQGMYGYYIIQYASEVEEGAVPLADVEAGLTDILLADKQDTVYAETVTKWVEEAGATVDYKALED